MTSASPQPSLPVLLFLFLWQTQPTVVGGVRAGAGNMGGAMMAGTAARSSQPPSGLIIGISIAVFAVLLGGMFLGRYWLCQRWSSKIQQARDHVIQDADAHGTKQRPLPFSSTAMKFDASYSDVSHNKNKNNSVKEPQLCSSMGTLEFSSENATKSDAPLNCRTITGSGRDEEGDFVIPQGLVSVSTGKCYWLQNYTKARARINQTARQTLVTGIFSTPHSSGILTLEEGQWQANTYTSGSFLKLEATTTSKA